MKRRSLFLGAVIMLSLSMILAACGGEKKSSGDAKGDSKVKLLTIATGGTGGTYYPLGGMMGKIIKDETGINADVITSGASSENMAILKDNKADIAFTQTDIVSYATKGELMFDGKKIDSLKGLGTLYPETIQIVTTKSDIKSVEDLKGKVVSVGAAGSGTRANAEQILEAYGMSFDDIKVRDLSFDDSTAGIQDGSIDAAFITAGTPTSAVEGLSATDTVSIVPIDADKADALIKKYPFYIKDEVPADTYKIKEAVPTIAVLSMLVVREDLPEDVVYKVTKAIYENTDKIKHSKAQFIKAESALNGMSIDLHPGAKKYFDEKGISQ
ncbi:MULTISPECIES: TAXI family TRAP transporter solute-binding subunit [Heyndrickxia]|uniref:TAXI family TRAP transporter solute-binding subunit n=1 Tax=Heyndrickxia TaxID=2837504 RepID=UPI00242C8DF9|nr:TAXI family TRAP transporter solute-binding subunit [Heyndrickxia oleronia]MCI1592213.1 TAXI family TRAP transporter solute-binding subunit [Heyndrickxia oleronia]MCI1615295.1 TAXI family TRAP transporter solute-binding subunit [Heyndrickxia oleronia]MCI1746071.1 TAXI family TRAP transporter solute-binding subunit [Heyndrickxia oleronia]MCI1763420.1 TAXI family TRAP transporter solute-binding subunit [Heyndrickxia oleronia]